jgi:hypothetical protein
VQHLPGLFENGITVHGIAAAQPYKLITMLTAPVWLGCCLHLHPAANTFKTALQMLTSLALLRKQ